MSSDQHTDAEKNLFLAIQANAAEQVRQLVEANPALFGAVSPMGVSPVLFATYYQKHDVAHVLIEAGAPLDVFEAAATGQVEKLRALLDKNPLLVNAVGADGFSPLGLSAFFGRDEVAAELLARGADVNAVSQNNMRVAPLHSAVAGHHARLAEALVKAGAEVNAAQQDGFTPLMGAAQNGNLALVEFLLEHGANVSAVTADGRTALSIAQEENREAVAARLSAAAE